MAGVRCVRATPFCVLNVPHYLADFYLGPCAHVAMYAYLYLCACMGMCVHVTQFITVYLAFM